MSSIFGKSIVFFTDIAGFTGGIERYVNQTAKWFANEGAKLTLVYQTAGKDFDLFVKPFDKIYTEIPKIKCDLVLVHKLGFGKRLEELYNIFGCEHVAVVVHDHDFYCPRSYFYRPFGRKNCSTAYSLEKCALCGLARHPNKWVNGFCGELRKQFIDFPLRLRLLKKAGCLIVLSKFMRNNLLRNGFAAEKIKILHPFIQLSDQEKHETNPPTVALVGQLIRGKGADIFVNMLARLKNPYQALIVGDGNERAYLEMLAQQLNVKVKFTGFTTNPEAYYSQITLMVLPFRWQEPFGLVGLESAARGIPVVAFNTGGISEWLHHNCNGIAVSPGNIDELAQKTDFLLSNYEHRERMSTYGRNLAVNEFSIDVFRSGMEEIIRQSANFKG